MNENNSYRNVERVPDLVGRLYEIVSELEALFPGRYFTPDGHLVGSLGEVMAAHDYGLVLYPLQRSGTMRGLRMADWFRSRQRKARE